MREPLALSRRVEVATNAALILASTADGDSEVALAPGPLATNPAAVYLTRLAPGSRRAMRLALAVLADLLSGGRLDPLRLPWHELRYQHTAVARAQLVARYAPASANKILSALRGVLGEAY